MNISKNHKNRKAHNWLVYKLNNKYLLKYSYCYKGTIYDLGCGEQPYKEYLLQLAKQYIGVDWSDTLHDLSADIIADLNKVLPIESNVADTVISLSVMEHLCEPQSMLNEAYRILKEGGYIVLQVPFQWMVHEAPYDYFRFTPYGLKYLFEKAGFQEIQVEAGNGFFSMITLKINYFSLRLIRGPKFLKL